MASLLQSAGAAIQVLANSGPTSSSVPSLAEQQAAFTQHTSTYFSTLSSIEVRLRRQVYALEEAGLVAAGDNQDARRAQTMGSDEREVVAGGPLDVSWLNARASDTSGKNMEKELWAKARTLAEKLQRKETDGQVGSEQEVKAETIDDDDMSTA